VKTRAGLTALIAVLVVACGSTPRSNAPGSNAPGSIAPSTPTASPSSASVTASPRIPDLTIHKIPQSDTTLLLDATTDGHEIVWSRGSVSQSVPDLYSFKPGAAGPTLVFRDPDADAQLSPLAVHDGRYACVGLFNRGGAGPESGWKLWYIGARGDKPIVVDSTETDPVSFSSLLPQISLTDSALIWTSVHLVDGKAQFFLRSYSTQSHKTSNLLVSQAAKTEFWFPNADDQGRLVYGTVEYATPGGTSTFHVYLGDLTKTPFQPRRLDATGGATNPVLHGDEVIWRTVTGNVSDWGQAIRFSLTTGATSTVDFESQTKLQYITAGNEFLAAWFWDSTELEIFDLVTNEPVVVKRYEATSTSALVRPVAAGDLVIFIIGEDPPGSDLQLCWLEP
jgi:hypothetical protein